MPGSTFRQRIFVEEPSTRDLLQQHLSSEGLQSAHQFDALVSKLETEVAGSTLIPFLSELGNYTSGPLECHLELVKTLAWTAPVCRLAKPLLCPEIMVLSPITLRRLLLYWPGIVCLSHGYLFLGKACVVPAA